MSSIRSRQLLDSPKPSPTKGKTPVAARRILDKMAKPSSLDFSFGSTSDSSNIFEIPPQLEPTNQGTISRPSTVRPPSPTKKLDRSSGRKEIQVAQSDGHSVVSRSRGISSRSTSPSKSVAIKPKTLPKNPSEHIFGEGKVSKSNPFREEEDSIDSSSGDDDAIQELLVKPTGKIQRNIEPFSPPRSPQSPPLIQDLSIQDEDVKPFPTQAKQTSNSKKRRLTIITIHDSASESEEESTNKSITNLDTDSEDQENYQFVSKEIINADNDEQIILRPDDIIIEETPSPEDHGFHHKKSVSPDPCDSPIMVYSPPPPSSNRPSPRNRNLFASPSTPTPAQSLTTKRKSKPVKQSRILDFSSSDEPEIERTSKQPISSRKNISAFTDNRDQFSMTLIQDLERSVFRPHGQEFPDGMQLVWNKRLNTTAGRANWKRITRGSVVENKVEIELSVKVVDSEEKLKCTLSHELCHVAAWIFDGEKKPAHGPAFKMWARRIMDVRKDIKVSTTHDYQIVYKYQWRCINPSCEKVYGRHSKSIDPVKHACGVCQGLLVEISKDGEVKIASPKKRSEYQGFLSANYKSMKEKNPSLNQAEIMKLLAQEWKQSKNGRVDEELARNMNSLNI